MHTKPLPEIDNSELKAVREFLTSLREEERVARAAPRSLAGPHVPLRNGIARARCRTRAAKTEE
jgi:hypothetical protein